MLSYPDNWQFNRDWLASQSEKEGQTAVRSALQELERYGYLRRERRKDPETGKFGWEHVLYDTPQGAEDVFAGRSTGGLPTDGKPTAGNPPSKEQLSRTTEEEDEVECPHSGRFAPSVGAAQNKDQTINDETPSNWHDQDRDLFRSIIGAKLESNGTKFSKGVWSADAFYKAYRTKEGKRLKWPGRYLQTIEERHDGLGVEGWMDDQGLRAVE